MATERAGLVPYLHYDDVVPMLDWLARAFGFVEMKRWPDQQGVVRNAEMVVGDTEIWLDGSPAGGRRGAEDPTRGSASGWMTSTLCTSG
jgi:uncharacterized glyoxalase superfamily protein PhnB